MSEMLKILGAFLLGVLLTVIAVKLLPAPEPSAPTVASAACRPSAAAVDELTDRQALDSRLDAIESEITGDTAKP